MNDLWTSARSLWVKFCGIADEYKMLRDRWLYLHSENKLPVLPYLRKTNLDEDEKTFDLLDKHVEKLEKLFGELGFERSKMESYNDFKQKTSGVDRVDIIDKLRLVEDYVYDLANFVGLLKFAFFQRTVSSEIPHVASGIPHSPERTIGNELFYLAADNVARRYYECLNVPYGKWDGFITFTPPIEEGYFYGAFCYPSPYLELFHVSMSEEAKYFVGSYLALAHEFGHSVMHIRYRIRYKGKIERNRVDYPAWFKILTLTIWQYTTDYLENELEEECENCPLYQLLSQNLDERGEVPVYRRLCEELLADIIACYIAGKNYVYEFLDSAYSWISDPIEQMVILLRVIPTVYYLHISGDFKVGDLMQKINSVLESAEDIRETYYMCPEGYMYSECISKIGSRWAKWISDFNKNVSMYIFNDLEGHINMLEWALNRYRTRKEELKYKGTIDEMDYRLRELLQKEREGLKKLINSAWRQLIPTIIVDRFKITKKEESEIKEALIEGVPVPEKDPRHILHCYYEAYRRSEGEERPNYAATIYSLAFNTFNQNKKED